jgi:hypothetical protein
MSDLTFLADKAPNRECTPRDGSARCIEPFVGIGGRSTTALGLAFLLIPIVYLCLPEPPKKEWRANWNKPAYRARRWLPPVQVAVVPGMFAGPSNETKAGYLRRLVLWLLFAALPVTIAMFSWRRWVRVHRAEEYRRSTRARSARVKRDRLSRDLVVAFLLGLTPAVIGLFNRLHVHR